MGKSLRWSKTTCVNVLTTVVSIGTYLLNSDYISQHPEVVAIGGTVIGVVNVVLRLLTNEPITGV